MFSVDKVEGTPGDKTKEFFRDEETEATEGRFTELGLLNGKLSRGLSSNGLQRRASGSLHLVLLPVAGLAE